MAKKVIKKKKVEVQEPLPELDFLPEPPYLETTHSFSTMLQRPNVSPYTSPIVTLRIGAQNEEYYVARNLLQNPTWIQESDSWRGKTIHLPDLDENTGHVLVHYLYTGTYQTLNDTETPAEEESNIEFKRAVRTYIMAATHNLPGLQHLARRKIERFGAGMTVFDVVEAIKEDASKLSSEYAWFYEYLGGKVRAVFEDDHTVFATEDLFGRVENVHLMRALARCVVGLYSKEVVFIHSEAGSVVGSPDDEITQVEDCPVEECPEELLVEDYPVEEPLVEEPLVEEPPTDDHPVNDHETQDTFTSDPPADDTAIQTTRIEVPDEPPYPEPEPIPQAEDSWGPIISSSQKKGKKSKKNKKGIPSFSFGAPSPWAYLEPRPEPEPEVVTEPQLEAVPVPVQEPESGPEPPTPPTPDLSTIASRPPQEEPPVDPFAGPVKTKKKKTTREIKQERQAARDKAAAAATALSSLLATIETPNGTRNGDYEAVPPPVEQIDGGYGEICLDRIEHLSRGDGWRKCGICAARVARLLPEMLS